MNKEFVSIIMSIHKNNSFLDKAIKSILDQTHKNFEFLIVQDGPQDDGLSSILKEFAQKDKRIALYKNEQRLGLTKSLNILIDKSNSNFIYRQDGDDISRKERLEYQLRFLNEKSLDACFTQAKTIQSGKVLHKKASLLPLRLLIKIKNPFIHGTMLIKKDVMEDVGYYDENFYYSQDYKLYIDLLEAGKKLKQLNKVLYELNTEDNISTNHKKEQRYYANCARRNKKPANK